MSSMTAVENICDNLPLAILPVKETIIKANMPVMEELEIDMGDYQYRHRNNFMKAHKIKMLDVLIEMKRLFPLHLNGNIYRNTRMFRFHPLYNYFKKANSYENRFEWKSPPTWFKDYLIKHIKEHPHFKIQPLLVNKATEMIEKWYENKGTNTDCGHNIYEWDRVIDKKIPVWNLGNLLEEMSKYHKWEGEYIYTYHSHYPNHQEEYDYTKKIKNELMKKYMKRDADGCYWDYKDNIEGSNKLKAFKDLTESREGKKCSLYYEIRDQFAYYCEKSLVGDLKDVLTLQIKRQFKGKRMDYKNNFIGKYHMLRWKKTMANGNCSNKDLKATHLYYRDTTYEGEDNKYIKSNSSGWIFQAVKIDDAIYCAEMNGFPKWGKKGNGKKKPTYKDIKMWWYKLGD